MLTTTTTATTTPKIAPERAPANITLCCHMQRLFPWVSLFVHYFAYLKDKTKNILSLVISGLNTWSHQHGNIFFFRKRCAKRFCIHFTTTHERNQAVCVSVRQPQRRERSEKSIATFYFCSTCYGRTTWRCMRCSVLCFLCCSTPHRYCSIFNFCAQISLIVVDLGFLSSSWSNQ